jgi:hypothetical protein
MIQDADEFVALRTSDVPEEYHRAAHEPATEEVWLDVIERYPEMRWWVAQNKTVPMSILELLSTDPDVRVREMVAAKRKLTRELMERLVRDPEDSVRLRIAYNRSTPLDLVRGLLSDPVPFVVEQVKSRLEWMGKTV